MGDIHAVLIGREKSFVQSYLLLGAIDEMVKSPASQAGGCGFDSRWHHHSLVSQWSMCFPLTGESGLQRSKAPYGSLAQMVEHPAVNRSVAGSSPAGAAILGYSQAVRQPTLTRSSLVRIQLPQPYAPMDKWSKSSAFHVDVVGSNPAGSTT